MKNCLYCSTQTTNNKYCSLSCVTADKNKRHKEKMMLKYDECPSYCFHCNAVISYDKKENKFCSRSCAARVTNKINRKRGPTAKEKFSFTSIRFLLCEVTNKWYSNRNNDGSYRRCSPYVKTEKQNYYNAARFKFNVYDYPSEFNIHMIEKLGWYTCPGKKRKNKVKNTNGVSRDHIISVSHGFKNKIDSKIISHPANCRIIPHTENKRKGEQSDYTLEDLIDKILKWDRKYKKQF